MKIGETLEGRFELTSLLGEGGMGQVFKAWDRQLERHVAIKTLLPQVLDDPAARDEMKREVKLSQRLSHPHIVSVFDYRVHERIPYIVMEFVEGCTLNVHLYNQPGHHLTEQQFTVLAEPILDAVGYAHRQGVIHRDLKPQNIMVQTDGQVKLMDFGIAEAIRSTYSRVTGKSSSLTPQYSSPEQINGEEPSPAMDIYSLGCVFYEILSGHPPFWRGDILHQQLSKRPEPLPGISAGLNAAILQCLVKDPTERPNDIERVRSLITGNKTVPLSRTSKSTPDTKPIADIASEALSYGSTAKAVPAAKPYTLPQAIPNLKNSTNRGMVWVGISAILLIVIFLMVWQSEQVTRERERRAWQVQQEETERRMAAEKQRAEQAQKMLVEQKKSTPPTTIMVKTAQAVPTTAYSPPTTHPLPALHMEFVFIPAGRFQMGSENGDGDEKPVHEVVISRGFELGKYEVTQGEWEAVMGNNPSYFNNCGSRCPVEQVSWDDIQEFLRRLNARGDGYRYDLPTEAEWEYACRAGTTGDYAGNLDEMGWYDKNSGNRTHPAGEKRANAWGLYDMHGNVYEWCSDWYGDYLSGTVTDPTGPSSGSLRVLRGGCWRHRAGNCRSALRGRVTPGGRFNDLGFRLRRTSYH